MAKLKLLLEKIGVVEDNETIFNYDSGLWKQKIPLRIKKGLEEIKADLLWIYEGKVIALFFDFTKNKIDRKKVFKKIWNLGGIPSIFIIDETTVDIYNGFSFDSKEMVFDFLKINNEIVSEENVSDKFSIWEILSGRGLENLSANNKSVKPSVDEMLLANLIATKNLLVDTELDDKYAQSIIGRLLFSRYLLDRKVKIDDKYFVDNISFLELIKNKELLYKYFDYLKKTFNGDLFPVEDEEVNQIKEVHLNYLHNLFSGSKISEKSTQYSLFNIYNFEIIPVELISEVYERFMGEEKQRAKGAYYTPSFLVDYVLEKTVKKHLLNNDSCKVFDPSCGSGIFLVESLRYIIENYIEKNGEIKKEQLKKILCDNIYGVDIDENAINLTAFSLCLTLLDYINLKDITNFKFPSLKEKNLFISDFFDVDNHFNTKISKVDFILGNPPWGSDKKKNSLHLSYKEQNNLPISDKQIAQTFMFRVKDFLDETTKSVLVLPSSILYNFHADEFRKYWLHNFIIDEILELSAVRKEIFSSATAPTMLVFFENRTKSINDNALKHISIKPNVFFEKLKLVVIEKNDLKTVKQDMFIKYDWLWKILLYGNFFDFYLIKRLKEEYENLNKIIEKNKLSYGQGFIIGGEKAIKYDAQFLVGKQFLDTSKKALSKFYIKDLISTEWSIDKLHRPRKKEVFQPPYILLKKGFNKQDFSLVAVYSEKEYVFTHSVTAIRGENKCLLKNITGVLNSVFSSYYLLVQGTSAGIEREQSDDKVGRFNIPIVINNEISNLVDEVQTKYKEAYSVLFNDIKYERELLNLKEKLDILILNAFEFSELEKSLLNYATEISIPLLNKKKNPIKPINDNQLKDYAKVFFNHFSQRWNGNSEYFEIDIYKNKYIIAMNFKIVDKKPKQYINFCEKENIADMYNLMKLGEEKITNVFCKQRDIRGFNETSFYVVKANQYKNWHPAIAYADLSEFVETMLQAEIESEGDF